MNRHDSKEIIFNRVEKIRKMVPNAILRTTVITGFPCETEEEFQELLEGIRTIKFDRLGAFAYSREEDTIAYEMEEQIEEEIKEKRLSEVFEAQKEISLELNQKRINTTCEVIVEEISEDERYFVCRSMMEAPDVDGRIYIEITEESAKKVIVGEFAMVKIIDCNEYDLFAKVI